MKPIIEIQNIGKKYKIGLHRGYLSLREQLVSTAKRAVKYLARENGNGGEGKKYFLGFARCELQCK